MRFDKVIPADRLKPFVKNFIISENPVENTYKVFPSTGLVIGFQYRGQLTTVKNGTDMNLETAGITGISNSFKIFKNSAGAGTILVYFTEVGFTHFTCNSANEFFNQSVSLDNIFRKDKVSVTEEKLATAHTDKQRITVVEQFLLSQLRNIQDDMLIVEAVKLIYASKGTIKIKGLTDKLFISQSPLEKRFKRLVGTTPKKFASIVRFNAALNNLKCPESLTEVCYEHNFFDQAHFIKDFKQYTGDTPEKFKRFLQKDDFLQSGGF